jgi:hypothetical protein
MEIRAKGLLDGFIVVVDTDEIYTQAAYKVEDSVTDKVLKFVLRGHADVYGRTIDNVSASPWGIVTALRSLGYEVKTSPEYIEPKSNDETEDRPDGLVF